MKFRRQYPIGPFILDFYSPELRLAIEIDGPVHYEEDQRLYDNRRDRYLTRHGIAIMRLPTETVEKDPDVAGDQIALAIEMRRR